MKRYRLSFADSLQHVPEHPDRTARKTNDGLDMDITYQVWPNRASMARSVRMQERGASRAGHWRPWVKLGDTEGY